MCAGVDEKRRPPPRGLKWPEPRTVPLDKGHPKWKTCPVVLVDSSRGQESFGRGITATSASSQRSSQFHSDDTSSSAKRSMHDGGTSFSNIVEVDMALRATVALCRGAVYSFVTLFANCDLLVFYYTAVLLEWPS